MRQCVKIIFLPYPHRRCNRTGKSGGPKLYFHRHTPSSPFPRLPPAIHEHSTLAHGSPGDQNKIWRETHSITLSPTHRPYKRAPLEIQLSPTGVPRTKIKFREAHTLSPVPQHTDHTPLEIQVSPTGVPRTKIKFRERRTLYHPFPNPPTIQEVRWTAITFRETHTPARCLAVARQHQPWADGCASNGI